MCEASFWYKANYSVCGMKTVGKVSPILVTLTSRSDSDFECSNVSLKESNLSIRYVFFSVHSEINRSSIEIGLFAQFLAKVLPNIVIFH